MPRARQPPPGDVADADADADADGSLVDQWRRAAERPRAGYDFATLTQGVIERPGTWNYQELIRRTLEGCQRVLLIEAAPMPVLTDGLATRRQTWIATTGRHGHLANPYGATIRCAWTATRVAAPWQYFDAIVSNRSSFPAWEMARLLHEGGTLLVEQPDVGDFAEVQHVFDWPATPSAAARMAELEASGFEVLHVERYRGSIEFRSVGDLLRYLQFSPWGLPAGFHVDRVHQQLLDCHFAGPAHGRPLVVSARRCLIVAQQRNRDMALNTSAPPPVTDRC